MTMETVIVVGLFLIYCLIGCYFLRNYEVIIKKLRFLLRPRGKNMSSIDTEIDYSMFDFTEAMRAVDAPQYNTVVNTGATPQISPKRWEPDRRVNTDWELVTTPEGRTFWVRQFEGRTELTEVPAGRVTPSRITINHVVEPPFKFDTIDLSGL